MKKLSRGSFEKARKWIEDNARPLEKSLLKFKFLDGSPDQVIEAFSSVKLAQTLSTCL